MEDSTVVGFEIVRTPPGWTYFAYGLPYAKLGQHEEVPNRMGLVWLDQYHLLLTVRTSRSLSVLM